MAKAIKKSFDAADESMHPSEKITSDAVEINGQKFYRITAQRGWKWSVDLKPLAKTDSCQMDHLLFMIGGQMVVRMDDGQELTYGPGDLAAIPPGHDGWGLGDEPTIWVEIPH